MQHHRLPLAPPQPRDLGLDDDLDPPLAQIDEIQLRRLASTVLSKSPDDLAALAETNPMLVWEWIELIPQTSARSRGRGALLVGGHGSLIDRLAGLPA